MGSFEQRRRALATALVMSLLTASHYFLVFVPKADLLLRLLNLALTLVLSALMAVMLGVVSFRRQQGGKRDFLAVAIIVGSGLTTIAFNELIKGRHAWIPGLGSVTMFGLAFVWLLSLRPPSRPLAPVITSIDDTVDDVTASLGLRLANMENLLTAQAAVGMLRLELEQRRHAGNLLLGFLLGTALAAMTIDAVEQPGLYVILLATAILSGAMGASLLATSFIAERLALSHPSEFCETYARRTDDDGLASQWLNQMATTSKAARRGLILERLFGAARQGWLVFFMTLIATVLLITFFLLRAP